MDFGFGDGFSPDIGFGSHSDFIFGFYIRILGLDVQTKSDLLPSLPPLGPASGHRPDDRGEETVSPIDAIHLASPFRSKISSSRDYHSGSYLHSMHAPAPRCCCPFCPALLSLLHTILYVSSVLSTNDCWIDRENSSSRKQRHFRVLLRAGISG